MRETSIGSRSGYYRVLNYSTFRHWTITQHEQQQQWRWDLGEKRNLFWKTWTIPFSKGAYLDHVKNYSLYSRPGIALCCTTLSPTVAYRSEFVSPAWPTPSKSPPLPSTPSSPTWIRFTPIPRSPPPLELFPRTASMSSTVGISGKLRCVAPLALEGEGVG